MRRLRELRPWELGLSAERELLGVRAQSKGLLEMTEHIVGGSPVTAYAAAIKQIVDYAQGGIGDRATVERQALDVLSALHSSPIRVVPSTEEAFEALDPEESGSEAVVACAAALGRARVESDRPVPDGWLAALASVAPGTIRVYTYARGVGAFLTRPEGSSRTIDPKSARVFLVERGVLP